MLDETDIGKYLRINELKLEEELCTCTAYYYTFASFECEAEDMYEQATLVLETYETELASKLRSDPTSYLSGKVTQAEVARHFRADPKWQELKKQQLKLQKSFRLLHKGASALEMKSRLLMSLNRRDLFRRDRGMERKQDEE